jgi:hypothetical protein
MAGAFGTSLQPNFSVVLLQLLLLLVVFEVVVEVVVAPAAVLSVSWTCAAAAPPLMLLPLTSVLLAAGRAACPCTAVLLCNSPVALQGGQYLELRSWSLSELLASPSTLH